MKSDPKKIIIKKGDVKLTTVKKPNIDDFIEKELNKFKSKQEPIKVDMKVKLEKNDDLFKSTLKKFDVKINMSSIKKTESSFSQVNIRGESNESTKSTPFVINKGLNEELEKNLLKKNIIEDLERGNVIGVLILEEESCLKYGYTV